jgi:pyrroline-5-carboxylate reductase
MKTTSLGFIGGGRITRIFLEALANRKYEIQSIVVFDTNPEVLRLLKQQYTNIIITETAEEAAVQPIVFIALHPPVIIETLNKVAGVVSSNAMVISLAPKITIEKIKSKLNIQNIARMIPNATSYINQGYNPVTFAEGFKQKEKAELIFLMDVLGKTIEVAEPKLEAYAILSAMLPTYFWFQWKELISLGKPMGLTEEESTAAIHQTLIAAINLYFESGLAPDKVTDLIPVKPLGENQAQFTEIYQAKLLGLFEKIKP